MIKSLSTPISMLCLHLHWCHSRERSLRTLDPCNSGLGLAFQQANPMQREFFLLQNTSQIRGLNFLRSVQVMRLSPHQSVRPEDTVQWLTRVRSRVAWSPRDWRRLSSTPNSWMENEEKWFPRKIRVMFSEKWALIMQYAKITDVHLR